MAIRHKRKNTASYSWQSSDLVEGQIGLNIADGTLHFQKSGGTTTMTIAQGKNSLVLNSGELQLDGDAASPGNDKIYGTNGSGTKGWYDAPSGGEDYFDDNCDGTLPSATGTDDVAIGEGATAQGGNDIAFGTSANANAGSGVAIGRLAVATGSGGTAVGFLAEATATSSSAFGRNAEADGISSSAFGLDSNVSSAATDGCAFGRGTDATAIGASAIGPYTQSTVAYGTVVGYGTGVNEATVTVKDKGRLSLQGTQAAFILPNYANTSYPTMVSYGMVYNTTNSRVAVSQSGGAPKNMAWESDIPTELDDIGYEYIHLQHKTAYNVHGGSYPTSNTWTKRPLNTEVEDTGSDCSLSSDEFTLDAGTYEIEYVGKHAQDGTTSGTSVTAMARCRLYNVSDSSVELEGQNASHYRYFNMDLHLKGRFVLASQKTLRIEHIAGDAQTSYGFGHYHNQSSTWGDNVYADVVIRKVA